ncbi:hypothetical protein D3C73_629530 [compost metagenome]
MLARNGPYQQGAFDLQYLVAHPQRQARGSQRHQQADYRQHGAMLTNERYRLGPRRQAHARHEYRQPKVFQQLHGMIRHMANRRALGVDPSADQPADQRPATTAQRHRNAPQARAQAADHQAGKNAKGQEHQVGNTAAAQLIAQRGAGFRQFGFGAHQRHQVAILHNSGRRQRQQMARPHDRLHEDATRAPRSRPFGQFTHRGPVDRLFVDDHGQLAHLEVFRMRLGQQDFRPDDRARPQREAAQAQHHHHVAGGQGVFGRSVYGFAVAQDAADHRAPAQLRLDIAHLHAVRILDDMRAPHQARQGGQVHVLVIARGYAQLGFQSLGRLAQIDTQQCGRHLAGEEHDADQAHQISQRVGRGDVGLHALHLGIGQAQVLERLGGRTHHRRFSRRSRRQARRRAGVQAKQRHGRQNDAQHQQRLDDRQGDIAQAGAVQVGEELRAARIAHGKNEQRESNLFQVAAHLATRLADQQGDDERAAHAAQLNRPDLQLADQVSQAHCDKQHRNGDAVEKPD